MNLSGLGESKLPDSTRGLRDVDEGGCCRFGGQRQVALSFPPLSTPDRRQAHAFEIDLLTNHKTPQLTSRGQAPIMNHQFPSSLHGDFPIFRPSSCLLVRQTGFVSIGSHLQRTAPLLALPLDPLPPQGYFGGDSRNHGTAHVFSIPHPCTCENATIACSSIDRPLAALRVMKVRDAESELENDLYFATRILRHPHRTSRTTLADWTLHNLHIDWRL